MIKHSETLRVNLHISISVQAGWRTGEYGSRIEDITSEGLEVAAPVKGGEHIRLSPGTRVRVHYHRGESGLAGRYTFTSRVLAFKEGPPPRSVLEYPREIRRIQKRNFFRLPVSFPVRYRFLDEEEPDPGGLYRDEFGDLTPPESPVESGSEGEQKEFIRGNSEAEQGGGLDGCFEEALAGDLSGNGIQLRVKPERLKRFEPGRLLRLYFVLEKGDESLQIFVKAEVARTIPEEAFEGEAAGIGLRFIDLDQALQDEIVNWLFYRQREMRKKGLL